MSWLSLVQQGGIAMIALGFCSVLVIAVILERMWAFSRTGAVPKELMRRVENLVNAGEMQQAIRLLDDSASPYARVAKASLLRKNASFDEIADVLTLACETEIEGATRPLPILATIGNISLYVGLIGTVFGIMKAFHAMSLTSSTAFEVVTRGVSEVLICTAAGLIVAIVAVVANNWCNAWVEGYRLRLERFATEWAYTVNDLLHPEAKVEEPVA